MSILLDSSFILALENKRDLCHLRAVELSQEIKSGRYGALIVTDYIFDETLTYLLVKQGSEKAVQTGKQLRSGDITFYKISDEVFENAWKLFQQKRKISFTDCTIAEEMKEKSIKYLASFDGGFEQFKEIRLVK